MYYPYLRAKQYEMLALRDFIQYNTNDCGIMPILEPVKTTFNSLRLLLEAYKRANKKLGIVLNPEVVVLVIGLQIKLLKTNIFVNVNVVKQKLETAYLMKVK